MHDPLIMQQAAEFLRQIDDEWACLILRVGPCTLQTTPLREPYEAMVRAVAYQQLHGRAAEAILNRFLSLFAPASFPSAAAILALPVETLRASGFSARKVNTIRAIASAVLAGEVPARRDAELMPATELIEVLTKIPGIGPWTVEMLMISTLERLDVLPALDFGVREGYKRMKSLSQQPTVKEMALIANPWSPYRTIAAWYLWRV